MVFLTGFFLNRLFICRLYLFQKFVIDVINFVIHGHLQFFLVILFDVVLQHRCINDLKIRHVYYYDRLTGHVLFDETVKRFRVNSTRYHTVYGLGHEFDRAR